MIASMPPFAEGVRSGTGNRIGIFKNISRENLMRNIHINHEENLTKVAFFFDREAYELLKMI